MKYLSEAALTLLIAAPALAQNAPGPQSPVPSANPPAQENAGNRFLMKESPNQWLVGDLWNKSVYNSQGKSIGNLTDVLIGQDGKIQALIVGVGGFLGLGEKNVAVDFDYLQKNGSIAPNRITLNMTEQDLRAAPGFSRTNNAR